MKIDLKRRTLVRLCSYGTAAVILLGVFAYTGWRQAGIYQRYIEYDYQQSFSELVGSVSAIDTALQKGMYSTSPAMLTALSAEVFRQAAGAQSALGKLPFSFEELENTARYLSQVGDYTYALSKKVASGQTLSDEEIQNIQSLSDIARQLSGELTALQSIINEENLRIGAALMTPNDDAVPVLGESMKQLESEFPEFPTLIYDGPFSEHIDKRRSELLSGQPEIPMEDALERAAAFLSLDKSLFSYVGEGDGKIPVYTFEARVDGGELSINVTKQGGYVRGLLNSRTVPSPRLSVEDGLRAATDFLNAHGFPRMKESYYMLTGNILLVNFAYREGDLVCYPDLIKVGIALDSGRVVNFESLGYLLNHHQRQPPTVKVTREDAQKAVSGQLSVNGYQLVIIPTAGENEALCHEFLCASPKGQKYIVYINAETGLEEKILILLEGDNGSLTL